MMQRIDARGLSCPQPLVLAKKHIDQADAGPVEIVVDTGTARDNIRRLAENSGWNIAVHSEAGDYILSLSK